MLSNYIDIEDEIMVDYKNILEFYYNKRVLVTGNTGFKGSWLTHILLNAGAEVIGYSLKPPTEPNLFNIAALEKHCRLHQVFGDVRDLDTLKTIFKREKPDIVFHLAAQPIVRDSYQKPVDTYAINVMGTVNVCECIRLSEIPVSEGGLNDGTWQGVESFLNVTTDKVYKNNEWCWGYREDEALDGHDPYSNSKSCSELVTHSYKNSFFKDAKVRVSTARAGNVIGGGDFASDRIIPDCVRTVQNGKRAGEKKSMVVVRNPHSIRPYEHVLEPIFVYLLIVKAQYENEKYEDYYNVGPDEIDCVSTGDLVDIFCEKWNSGNSRESSALSVNIDWKSVREKDAPHEANFLKLDCSKLKSTFLWKPRWHIEKAVEQSIQFTRVWLQGADTEAIQGEMNREIREFINYDNSIN